MSENNFLLSILTKDLEIGVYQIEFIISNMGIKTKVFFEYYLK